MITSDPVTPAPRITVDTHIHTVASGHAFSTVTENAREAASRGLAMIANTDHGPDLPGGTNKIYFKGQRVIPRFIAGVAVLRGIEANIRHGRGTDCTESMEAALDLIMAGFHAPVYNNEGEAANTRRLISVISSGRVDVITHPANTQYPISLRDVIQAARDCRTALEINCSRYTRTDSRPLAVQLAALAAEEGAPLIMGSDAHICYDIGCFDLGLGILEEAGVDPAILVNATPLRLLEFLQSRGRKNTADLLAHFQSTGEHRTAD